MSRDEIIDILWDNSKFVTHDNNPVIKYFNGTYNDFFHQFLLTNRPCIIENVTHDWRSTSSWTVNDQPNFEYLSTRYGNVEVNVADCNEKYYNTQLKTTTRFRDFIEYWKNLVENEYPNTEPCLYLKDWHFTKDFPHDNVYRVPFEFCNDWLNEYFTSNENYNDDYRFVYMGPKGSWTPFHVDVFTSYSWSVNICGMKKWILLPPNEELKLKDKFNNLPYDVSFLEEAENHENIKFIVVYQKAGEAIFVPSGWHHQVWNLKDTISINHNWVNACNLKNMWSSMLKILEDVKKEIIGFQYTMNDWSSHCQLLLKSCYGMDFDDFYNFLLFILNIRKNKLSLPSKLIGLKVFGDWIIGEKHMKYDLENIQEMLKTFFEHPDVKVHFNENNNNNNNNNN